jgi:GTP-binding protein EngB required for normal cell division
MAAHDVDELTQQASRVTFMVVGSEAVGKSSMLYTFIEVRSCRSVIRVPGRLPLCGVSPFSHRPCGM